ncbi:polyprenyl synthetase family protein [Legionella bononiensis]|uniref:Polyprenyl synthetase family protein n=1 Tax=Legionella bononiensis TaxID=2793102 RepID=A0ABS1WAY1_9GAMM|nr:farnesyl diphosphate synthase [Legionella bononiensis]MBL7480245.1 polyprenyl synthetase family protein [Legionella bononiensis]MBL7526523.1 polyprenyl synthetase family protein [Legionella bononiensis]MBL7562983.1 polyprenyl synthetase family protein [Legionella bononiensis]
MSQQVIDTYIQRHENCLKQILNTTHIPADRIYSALNYSLFPGGKRIRPIMVYLTGELLDIDIQILDIIAAAIELTHCYSLIHDDLPAMDDDDLRRGKPSCHKAYDEATAILVGDGMQALAIEVLLTHLPGLLSPSQIVSITRTLVRASGVSGMVSGQSLDLTKLAFSSVSEEELRKIHLLKTGQLIMACFEMVLAAQKTTHEHTETALREYAQHIGLVFQMQDDYLDRYAPANLLGKGRSSDTANQKTTFATLYTKQQLEEKIAEHYQLALDSLTVFDQKATALIELTGQLHNRSNCS